MEELKIADLHCDLLCYLAQDKKRSAFDPDLNCSIPNMKKGGVFFQTLAIFTETKKGSSQIGEEQLISYLSLPKNKDLQFQIAIESGSSICDEDEPLEEGLKRLARFQKESGKIMYLSLTWNSENRFGGGNASQVGLKRDGEVLLDFLAELSIPVDFSHTSDALAGDIFSYIEKKNLPLRVLASHSNFRQVTDHPRNLPDEFAKEIIKRKGLLGINFVRGFIGHDPSFFVRQIEHGLSLGAESHLCFGADFFSEADTSPELDYLKPFFFHDFSGSSCYSAFPSLLQNIVSKEQMEKIANKNFLTFFDEKVSFAGMY